MHVNIRLCANLCYLLKIAEVHSVYIYILVLSYVATKNINIKQFILYVDNKLSYYNYIIWSDANFYIQFSLSKSYSLNNLNTLHHHSQGNLKKMVNTEVKRQNLKTSFCTNCKTYILSVLSTKDSKNWAIRYLHINKFSLISLICQGYIMQ